jgi:hypothetical protein
MISKKYFVIFDDDGDTVYTSNATTRTAAQLKATADNFTAMDGAHSASIFRGEKLIWRKPNPTATWEQQK